MKVNDAFPSYTNNVDVRIRKHCKYLKIMYLYELAERYKELKQFYHIGKATMKRVVTVLALCGFKV